MQSTAAIQTVAGERLSITSDASFDDKCDICGKYRKCLTVYIGNRVLDIAAGKSFFVGCRSCLKEKSNYANGLLPKRVKQKWSDLNKKRLEEIEAEYWADVKKRHEWNRQREIKCWAAVLKDQ